MMKDYRVGLKQEYTPKFALITLHNLNVRRTRNDFGTATSVIGTKSLPLAKGGGIVSTVVGANRKILVKTFRDRTSQVIEER